MKKRKIHRPGVPAISAQNEQGEDEGIGVNAPVPFVFPRNEPKRVKALATWDFSHVLLLVKHLVLEKSMANTLKDTRMNNS